MELDEIERAVQAIQDKPLMLLCQMPSGKMSRLTIRQCWTSGARFIHVGCTEIDAILGVAMGGDNERV